MTPIIVNTAESAGWRRKGKPLRVSEGRRCRLSFVLEDATRAAPRHQMVTRSIHTKARLPHQGLAEASPSSLRVDDCAAYRARRRLPRASSPCRRSTLGLADRLNTH